MTSSRRAPAASPDRGIRIVHSSDLHVDDDYTARLHDGDGTTGLRSVLQTAHRLGADVVILAGDVFENNRLSQDLVRRAGEALAAYGKPVVILPGNHDPLVADSAHHRGALASIANVAVIGLTHREAVAFSTLDLEIWGHAHRDYDDMDPLRRPRRRRSRWQIAVAHGHYEPRPDRSTPYRPSWLISAAELTATAADYVALGHWNRPVCVGPRGIKASYSGCPELARSVNLVCLGEAGTTVRRRSIDWT